MNPHDPTFAALVAIGITHERVATLLADLGQQLPSEHFYVFQTGSGGGAVRGSGRQRTLMAFASPDVALLFAQRNRLMQADTLPRLQTLALPRLFLAMALAPNIASLLLIPDSSDPQPGQVPSGIVIERSTLLR